MRSSHVWLTAVIAVLAASNAAFAAESDRYDLTAQRTGGQLTRLAGQLQVGGDLKFTDKGKVNRVPMSVAADIAYDEMLLLDGDNKEKILRSVRHYEKMEALIKIDKGSHRPKLSDARRLIAVDIQGGQSVLYSPRGPLTREELDLTAVVGNSLVFDSLLPGKSLAVSEKWSLEADVVGALLGLDAVAECQVESELVEVAGGKALIHVAGTVDGAAEGVSTKIELKAKYHFDLKQKRVTAVLLAVKEDRSIGHVGPGVDVVAKLKMSIEPIETSKHLTEDVLAGVDTTPTEEATRLVHDSKDGSYRFLCDRRWYVMSDERQLVVLRMVDRGDLVAQCNVSPVIRRSPEKKISLDQYQNDVKHSLGKRFGRIVAASQGVDGYEQLVYRVAAHGQVEDLPIEWRYYLVHHPSGLRAALSFTVEASLAERLGNADEQMIAGFQIVGTDVSSKPKAGAAR